LLSTNFSKSYVPWGILQFSALFLSLLTDIHFIFGTLLCHTKIQIKFWVWSRSIHFSLSYGPWTYKNIMNSQFSALFFSLLTDIHLLFETLLSNTKLQLRFHCFFTKLWSLDLEKYHELSVFRTFFSLLTGIHLIFGTLLCHTKLQIKCEFGFDPLIFHEVTALGLGRI
jgi:hypothetical protein